MQCTFTAQLWIWDARKSDSWVFVTLPPEHSDDIRVHAQPGSGFRSVRVEVSVGSTTWLTSVFPDKESGCYVLPIKAGVRAAEHIGPGDSAEVHLRMI